MKISKFIRLFPQKINICYLHSLECCGFIPSFKKNKIMLINLIIPGIERSCLQERCCREFSTLNLEEIHITVVF